MTDYNDYNGSRAYTEAQVAEMGEMLCRRETDSIDDNTIYDVLVDGCTGWAYETEPNIVFAFEEIFENHDWGDSDALYEHESLESAKAAIAGGE